jgi:membrane-bound metal-dependent hydrolase YbcI (DUF457 family)
MFFLFHVLAGIIIGLLLGDLLHDNRWIVPCVIGAALPDLIDKPFGYILFPQSIGYGRFLFHNFFLLVVILIAGLVIWKSRKTPVVLALATGILSHQILDSMWREPANWFWPLMGPLRITGASTPDYLIQLVKQDLYNPSEWLVATACVAGVLLFLCRDRFFARARKNRTVTGYLLTGLEFLFFGISGIVIGFGVIKKSLPLLVPYSQGDYFMAGIVIALGAVLVLRWRIAFEKENSGNAR